MLKNVLMGAVMSLTLPVSSAELVAKDFIASVVASRPYALQAELTPPKDPATFGFATASWHDATSGADWVVIGAPDENASIGAAYVFSRAAGATTWTSEARLVSPDGVDGDKFGGAVAIDRSTIIVGAPFHQDAFFRGAAYVFVRSDTGDWHQQGTELNGSDKNFGLAVAVHDNAIAVGDPVDNTVYYYERNVDTWSVPTTISAPAEMSAPNFGIGLWLGDGELLVGAPNDSAASSFQGSAAYFTLTRGVWNLQQILRPETDAGGGQQFGISLCKSAHGIAVGAPHASGGLGAVYGFSYDDGLGRWTLNTRLVDSAPDGNPAPPQFGTSVAMAGKLLVAGTPGRDRAVIYSFRSGTWSPISELKGDKATFFGQSVSTAGSDVIVGATQDGIKPQAAYVFSRISIFAEDFE